MRPAECALRRPRRLEGIMITTAPHAPGRLVLALLLVGLAIALLAPAPTALAGG